MLKTQSPGNACKTKRAIYFQLVKLKAAQSQTQTRLSVLKRLRPNTRPIKSGVQCKLSSQLHSNLQTEKNAPLAATKAVNEVTKQREHELKHHTVTRMQRHKRHNTLHNNGLTFSSIFLTRNED